MKRLLALLLALTLALSIVGCANNVPNTTKTLTSSLSSESSESFTGSDLSSFDTSSVTSLEDFVSKLEDSGFENIKEEDEDGNITVELKKPTTDDNDKDKGPAIPTIETVKPTIPEKDEEDTSSKETSSKDNTSSKDDVSSKEITSNDDTSSEETSSKEEESSKPTAPSEPETPAESEEEKEEQQEKTEYTYTTGQAHQKLHYSKRYLYSTLTEKQKEWYRKIDTAINNLEESVEIGSEAQEGNNYFILYMYLFDNPEHFYVCFRAVLYPTKIGFYYSVGKNEGEYSGYGFDALTDGLREKIRAKKQTFENEANRILSTIPANAPDVWKEKLIYDRILADSYYNLNATWDYLAEDNWTAYGILVNKHGVCESYSEAFQTLCLYAGICCTGVVGTAGGGHKWNAVKLDGEWYMCDITFDDPLGAPSGVASFHTYFNLTSNRMSELNHDWSDCDYPVPDCRGTKYSYNNYFNK